MIRTLARGFSQANQAGASAVANQRLCGRLRLWPPDETAVLAATSLDVVRLATRGDEARG